MVAVPISRSGKSASSMRYPYSAVPAAGAASLPAPAEPAATDWTNLIVAGTLLAGGALMVAGHRRAGLAVATAGTALALLEEQDALAEGWKKLPQYLSDAQDFLDKVEHYLGEASIQGQRLQSILHR
jgi:hypothetical protein